MEHIDFVMVDRRATGERLQRLRKYNIYLHRYVCHELHLHRSKKFCDGVDCDLCEAEDFEEEDISQPELGKIMGVSGSQVANWETGRTLPDIEFLIFYCRLCRIDKLEDLLVFEK